MPPTHIATRRQDIFREKKICERRKLGSVVWTGSSISLFGILMCPPISIPIPAEGFLAHLHSCLMVLVRWAWEATRGLIILARVLSIVACASLPRTGIVLCSERLLWSISPCRSRWCVPTADVAHTVVVLLVWCRCRSAGVAIIAALTIALVVHLPLLV